jgi:Bacterial regulatory proteins, gntR family
VFSQIGLQVLDHVEDRPFREAEPGHRRDDHGAVNEPERLIPATAYDRQTASVLQLQQEYGVGHDTVLRAIEILREESLVFTVPRRGIYVSPDTK